MDMRENGEWNLVMHGPDGTDYKNQSVFKKIVKHKKIVYQHRAPKFLATIDFEALGNKTRIDWQMLFETKEEFIRTIKSFKADDGLRQNVEKLEQYLKDKVRVK
jgi:uncharacterized protein YndB with AHSA1/START domain